MPKLIDYADRYEAVREVVYEITLEQGVAGISTAAVAERLHLSSRTLQRLVASADVLPLLGLQRAERLERNRFHRRRGFRPGGACRSRSGRSPCCSTSCPVIREARTERSTGSCCSATAIGTTGHGEPVRSARRLSPR